MIIDVKNSVQKDNQQLDHISKYFFGIEFKTDKVQGMDYREVAARIFLCPTISFKRVNAVVDCLENKKMSITSFLQRTDAQILRLREKNEDDNITDLMIDRIEEWPIEFEGPDREDWAYITELFGFTYENLYLQGNNSDAISSAEEMADYVKQYVIGQDEVINQLAVPFWQHLESKRNSVRCPIKTPVILIGHTGSGKTEIYTRFAEVCGECPIIQISSNEITPMSWKGIHITDYFLNALKAGVEREELEHAVLVFDEFDKITHYNSRITGDKGADMDVDLQRDIMHILDNETITIFDDNPLTHSQYNGLKLSTKNMMVVFAGAFSGIEDIIKRRCNAGKAIGYVNQVGAQIQTNWMKRVCEKDLEEWGYLPELIGRIGYTCVLNPISSDVMVRIMSSAKESVLQAHIDYCKLHNVNLIFTDEAIRYIAELAYNSGLGFRNVKTLLARCLSQMYFQMGRAIENHEQQVNVDKAYIEKALSR
ncbi:MAG: AAA family ATPase [Bacteroidales bacterium]|nr:AAA family ATPase [Bacteroidales bacterium]